MKKTVTIGMAGAGRATELHMGGYTKLYGINVRYKWVFAKQEELASAKQRYGFEFTTANFDDLLNDPEVDVIDICTPPYMHAQLIIEALNAGKHVICEKPLTGYFGNPEDERPIGDRVSKVKMYEGCLENIREIEDAIMASDKYFMYAENFVYAPAILKAAEIVQAKKSRILYMKGEESLKGSSSPVAGEWEKTGGGTFIRTGTHPLSAILWLKQQEAKARNVEIKVKSVVADMARITPSLSDYEHRHIAARPHDVEDCGTVIIEFSDGTRAVVIATDTLLGGSKNYVELYCNDAAIYCTLTLNNLMSTYFLDEDGLDNVPISEMLPSKTGWNNPFVSDEIIRGYTNEIQDFMEAVTYNREPKSGFQLAKDTVKVIYAAYLSAEQGKKIEL
jgi:predicted dehydrogenase